MEEVPENGKESSHFAHANGMNEVYNIGTLLGSFLTVNFQSCFIHTTPPDPQTLQKTTSEALFVNHNRLSSLLKYSNYDNICQNMIPDYLHETPAHTYYSLAISLVFTCFKVVSLE
jgi:hypothetical protein